MNFHHCGIGAVVRILLITQQVSDMILMNFLKGWDVSVQQKTNHVISVLIWIRKFLMELSSLQDRGSCKNFVGLAALEVCGL